MGRNLFLILDFLIPAVDLIFLKSYIQPLEEHKVNSDDK